MCGMFGSSSQSDRHSQTFDSDLNPNPSAAAIPVGRERPLRAGRWATSVDFVNYRNSIHHPPLAISFTVVHRVRYLPLGASARTLLDRMRSPVHQSAVAGKCKLHFAVRERAKGEKHSARRRPAYERRMRAPESPVLRRPMSHESHTLQNENDKQLHWSVTSRSTANWRHGRLPFSLIK